MLQDASADTVPALLLILDVGIAGCRLLVGAPELCWQSSCELAPSALLWWQPRSSGLLRPKRDSRLVAAEVSFSAKHASRTPLSHKLKVRPQPQG